MSKIKWAIYISLSLLLLSSCVDSVRNKAFNETVKQLQKDLPKKIDDITIWDSVSYNETNNVFNYYYTLVDIDLSTLDTLSMVANLKVIIQKGADTEPSMEAFRRFRTMLGYTYFDENGNKIISFEIMPKK